MFRHQPTIFLGMELGPLAPHLLFYPELKRRRGLGGIIPRIEVCHVGNIPFRLVQKIGVWRGAAPSNISLYAEIKDAVTSLLSRE
jgi:hypothetical protein